MRLKNRFSNSYTSISKSPPPKITRKKGQISNTIVQQQ
uniref:Uncharacterized protein n=1 Tax=Rhizophora mucronata TaxID=61149 RepID=A0A2P2J3Z0_RHIMU